MIEVSNLHSGYGRVPVVAGVSLDVADGEILGVLGYNGMGKTTLLKTLVGLLPVADGRIVLAGEDVTRIPVHVRARKGIGYVPQGREIFPGLSVLENLQFAARSFNVEPKQAVASILEEFPRLQGLLGRRGGALSGGEQQLLAFARALVRMPKVLLMDEPTEGVQPSIVEEIVDKVEMLRKRRGLTMLLVEQNLDFINAVSDRVLLLHKGEVVKDIRPAELSGSVVFDDLSHIA